MENTPKQAQKCEFFGECPWPRSCNSLDHDNASRLCERGRMDRSDNPAEVWTANPAAVPVNPEPQSRGIMSFRNLILLAIILGAFVSLAIAWS